MTVVSTKPAALSLESAAEYLSMSPALLQKQTQHDSTFPKPVQITARRVAWRTEELDAWLLKCPRSQLLPPKNSGYGRRGKPTADSSATDNTPSQ